MTSESRDGPARPAHRLLFDLKIAKATGSEFQELFERIMEKHDSSFSRIKPGGPTGDWKSDGYSQADGTIYQCYAPGTVRAAVVVAKIADDFAGAIQYWGTRLKRWVFVVNKDSLPAEVIAALSDLKQAQAPGIGVDWHTPERLWGEFAAQLQETELDNILGRLPPTESAIRDLVKQAWKAVRSHENDRAYALCKTALDLAADLDAYRHDRADTHHLLAHLELKSENPEHARRHVDLADRELRDSSPSSFHVNGHRLRAASWAAEDRQDLADKHYRQALEIEPSDQEGADELQIVNELHCFTRADLVINGSRTGRLADLVECVENMESFARAHPSVQDGHLLLHVAEALICYHARRQDDEKATRALDMIRDASATKELAFEASSLLLSLTGRAIHLDAAEIAIACAQLSADLSNRAERPDFYWAAQSNIASAYLSTGKIEQARRQLEVLDPILRNEHADPQLKAGILSLAAEVLARSGASGQAIVIMEKAQQHMRSEPRSVAQSEFERGRYLVGAGRVVEGLAAFQTAERLGRETKAPGKILFRINVEIMKAATDLGRWPEAESALATLQHLPQGNEFVDDVLVVLRKQLEGTRVIKGRLEEIRAHQGNANSCTLAEANARALQPLLTWWHECAARAGEGAGKRPLSKKDSHFGELGVLYDYWGGGSAAQIMTNLRDHAPYHFTPLVEVRTIQDIRRAIRMLTLVSDCVVLLWKGVIESGMAIARAPFDCVCGGAGYMAMLGDEPWMSKKTGPWFPIMGEGAFLPIEVIKLLATDALPLIEQGRLVVFPAPAVGCYQEAFGASEQLLAGLMSATPLAQISIPSSAFPLGVLPYFEDAPLGLMADLVAKDASAPRRLRLALIRKTNELRMHGAAEAVNREIADEIADALASLDGSHRDISRKRGYTTRHDRFGATAVSFQNEWAPVLTLNRLGYRMTLAKPQARDGENRERFVAKVGTPFGNWLHLPGRHVTVPAARRL